MEELTANAEAAQKKNTAAAAALSYRVAELEGQAAETATQHAALAKELEAKLALVVKEHGIVLERNKKGKAALAKLKDECIDAEARAKGAEVERDALQAKLADVTRTFEVSAASAHGAAATELQTLKDEVKRVETVTAQERAKVEKLSSQREALQGELAAVRADVSAKDEMLRAQKERVQLAEANRSSVERALEREKQSRSSTVAALQTKLTASEASAAAQKENMVALQAKLAGQNAEATEDAATHAADAADSIAKLESKIVILTEQKQQQHVEVDHLQQILVAKSDQIMALERSKQELEEQIITDQITNLMAQTNAIEEQVNQLELEGARKNKEKIAALTQQRDEQMANLTNLFDRQRNLLEVTSSLNASSSDGGGSASAGVQRERSGNGDASGADGGGGGGGGAAGGGGDSNAVEGGSATSELAESVLQRQADGARLRKYIEQLVAEAFTYDEKKAMEVMTGLPRLEDVAELPAAASADLGTEVLEQLLSSEESTISSYEQYIDDLLGRIIEFIPEMMDSSEILSSLLG